MYRCPVNFICWQVERCCLLPAAISPLGLEIPTRRLTARYTRNNPAAWRNPRVVTQPPFDLFNVNSEHRGFGPPVMAVVGCGHQFNGHELPTRTGYANPAVTARRVSSMFECAHWRISADYLVVVHHKISNYCVVGETGDVSVASKTSMVSTCGTIYVYTTRGQRFQEIARLTVYGHDQKGSGTSDHVFKIVAVARYIERRTLAAVLT
ncbi:hypothetical protein ALC57_16596 [Trachymyrmex cornetzi]|uniref:Uncharacterized protein n=1 Tax=Trachymyrmex cornetzi TaxID=471704 RepID=A0A151IV69_9HYME|nr:hypothetical protein ALC57_16596 [Trachymyrmex cornetzi]